VVVARADLPRGTPVSAATFAVRDVPSAYVHASAVRPDAFERVERQRLGSALQRGEVLLLEHLDGAAGGVFSAMLQPGRRALTVEVDDRNAIAGLLRPGDRIDLLVSVRDARGGGVETTWPLLAGVEVLATGQAVRRSDGHGERSYSSITLDVSPEDAHRIVVARAAGALSAALRHPDDPDAPELPPLALDDVLGRTPPPKANPAAMVEILVGGGDGR
jgi:pilus assembly protein CpaB